ncbi:hypothetical protein BDW02DRAFT_569274 [Decorospora gaudefroyi]|uniref:Uncharacterized protein n=1 Tax=Decorospora gaudefroyi TaxID=184978 RepID=A0A6A5KF32_9PLEO|nr:hypothetical protein BDW02DRAFT_569274 [Decorospora gaudefroyi]
MRASALFPLLGKGPFKKPPKAPDALSPQTGCITPLPYPYPNPTPTPFLPVSPNRTPPSISLKKIKFSPPTDHNTGKQLNATNNSLQPYISRTTSAHQTDLAYV